MCLYDVLKKKNTNPLNFTSPACKYLSLSLSTPLHGQTSWKKLTEHVELLFTTVR